MLGFVHFFLLIRQPTNRSRIEQKLRAGERGQTRRFRKPLVPANQRADFAMLRLMSLKAKIARCEIKLFVIERIIGNVHLAILARDLSVSIDGYRRIVVNAGSALLEQRSNDHDLLLTGYLAEGFGRWSGNGFGELESLDVFRLAEIL